MTENGNKYFSYPGIELWDADSWTARITPLYDFVQWIGAHDKSFDTAPYAHPYMGLYGDDVRKTEIYKIKTRSADVPEVVAYWKARGVHYECRSQGGVSWIMVAPDFAMKDFSRRLPSTFAICTVDLNDPYFAMKTMERFSAANEYVAEHRDRILVYICNDKPDAARIFVNILQEAYVLAAADTSKISMFVDTVVNEGTTLKETLGFAWHDEIGEEADPDAHIVYLAGLPTLDVTGQWENLTSLSRDQMTGTNWSTADYEPERLIHSQTGADIAAGFALEHRFRDVYSEEFTAYWENMGLCYESHVTQYRHWKSAVPMEALEKPEVPIPVIAVMQEVNSANEHLAVTETQYFYEYFRLAAQGQCILINFALEDHDSNDLLADILEEACGLYPMIDRSRIYIAGHSHNGYFALEFALRHPRMIAAVAQFGDTPGFNTYGNLPMIGERAANFKKIDMPIIVLDGYTEHIRHFPISESGSNYRPGQGIPGVSQLVTREERIASWQRRLDVMNCPMKTAEEIIATRTDGTYAEKMLGIPGDRSETAWIDGAEVYIVDVKNNEGRFHLRVVGEENRPHNTTPVQQKLSWSFLRRFARSPEDGSVVERY